MTGAQLVGGVQDRKWKFVWARKRSDQFGERQQALPTLLKGMAWAHSRGYTPLVAASQVFADFHPDVDIHWAKRSLWEFGEGSLISLADEYDVLLIDHPLVEDAAELGLLLPLDGSLDGALLAKLASGNISASYQSYAYGGRQWAVPVDAAAMVSVSRPDLMARYSLAVPTNWVAAVTLARETQRVAMPLSPVNALCAFFSLCANLGSLACFDRNGKVVEREIGMQALAQLQDLASLMPRECFDLNPVQVMHRMSIGGDWLYCPLVFGYSNYARRGYAPHRLRFHNFPGVAEPYHAGAALGGAGLAISARTRHRATALELVAWLVEDKCQSTVYAYSGGQPSSLVAWRNEMVSAITDNYFHNIERTLERAYIRPNYPGMAEFQTQASAVVWHYLQGPHDAKRALAEIDRLFAQNCADPNNGLGS